MMLMFWTELTGNDTWHIMTTGRLLQRSNEHLCAENSDQHISYLRSRSLFVCLGFIVRFSNFSLIWRRHHYRWRAAYFDLCSVLTDTRQLGFFSVLQLMWHRTSVYNDNLRGLVIPTTIAERLAAELSLSDIGLSRLGFGHSALTESAIAAAFMAVFFTSGACFSKKRRFWRTLVGLTKIRQFVSWASIAFFKAA